MPDASSARSSLSFGFWVPSISGGLIASKIPSTTDWTPAYNRKLAQTAERVGFEWALTQIRFTAGYGAEFQHESVTFTQHLLEHTEKLKVVAAILPGPWNPLLAAKQLTTIDIISSGRVAINVVSGWFKTEFTKQNQPWLEHAERYRRSEEFIQVLKGLWTEKEFTFRGDFYQFRDFALSPKPAVPPTIYQGGNSADARGMAARVSDILLLNGQGTISDFRELIEDTKKRAIEEGRTDQVQFGVNAFVILRDTEEEAAAVLHEIQRLSDKPAVAAFAKEVQQAGQSSKEGKGMWSNSDAQQLVQFNDGFKSRLIGTAEQIADRILLFRSLGIDHILVAFVNFQEELEEFGNKVIPLVKQLEKEGRGLDAEFEIAKSGAIYQ
ncbi:uncharacterized protein JCM15063_002314 [Sporobolomyces koalae]|uniref:uncharacterized protein n=1 Tax=Sporobolomyces koalae TaxID=500713 RepID=UPI003175B4E9